jgi:hypothetical protein
MHQSFPPVSGTATIDFVPYFSVLTGELIQNYISFLFAHLNIISPLALDFRQWLGAQILGTSATALDPSGEMMLNMVCILPQLVQEQFHKYHYARPMCNSCSHPALSRSNFINTTMLDQCATPAPTQPQPDVRCER